MSLLTANPTPRSLPGRKGPASTGAWLALAWLCMVSLSAWPCPAQPADPPTSPPPPLPDASATPPPSNPDAPAQSPPGGGQEPSLLATDGQTAAGSSTGSDGQQQTPAAQPPVIIARTGQPAADKANTEVVSLVIIGNKPWQRLAVEDLDVILLDSGQRLLPLVRMTRLLKANGRQADGRFTFQFESGPRATLEPATGRLTYNGTHKTITTISRTSEITGLAEIYIPAQVVGQLSGLVFKWNEMEYGFQVHTDLPLSVWKVPEAPSLLGIQTQRMAQQLPSMHPAARPEPFSLDFIDVELQLGAEIIQRGDQPAQAQLSNLQQTFYGQLAGGGYKLRLSQPGLVYDQRRGLRLAEEHSDPLRIDYFDWIQSFDGGELALGDANYGLNDLVFPYVEFTGLRINGIAGPGWPDDVLSSRFTGAIVRPQRFNGVAPVGSRVDLFINGQLVDTDQVLTIDPDAPAGFGVWEFQDIRLSPGALNEIRIRVTDPNGTTTQIERDVLGSELLLPPGGLAYLGGAGSRRDRLQMDMGGFFAGGRLLYGLTPRLTLGAVVARQDHFHQFFSPQSPKPVDSTHLGVEAFWMPIDPLMIVADLAVSLARTAGTQGGEDLAGFLRASYHLSRRLVIGGSFFYYGPRFFNGQTQTPSDRMGGWLSTRWQVIRQLSLEAVAGRARNHLGQTDQPPLHVDFQSLVCRAHPLNGLSLGYNLDRLAPDDDRPDRLLHTLQAQASPLPRLDLYAYWSQGDDVTIQGQDGGFFDGLNIPSLNLGQTAYRNFRARYALDVSHSVGLDYFDSPGRRRLSALHDWRTFSRPYLLAHTELGRDLDTATWFFENRTDWRFDRKGDWRLGFRARLEDNQWSVGLFFTITDQFVVHDNSLYRTADTAPDPDLYPGLLNPDFSGAIAGSVFIDADADGIRDDDEQGLAGIGVIVEDLDQVTSDKAGRFLVARLYQARQVRLWLDMDSLPAIYSPTHALQTAVLRPRSITTVHLGVTPAHSLTGRLIVRDPAGRQSGLAGARVQLFKQHGKTPLAESVTATDGSYYLGDLRPGTYRLAIDRATVPLDLTWPEHLPDRITIAPSDRPVEVKVPPVVFTGRLQTLPSPRRPEQGPPPQPQIVLPSVQLPLPDPDQPLGQAQPSVPLPPDDQPSSPLGTAPAGEQDHRSAPSSDR